MKALAIIGLASAALLTQAAPLPSSCYDETGTLQLYDPKCCCTHGWCGPLEPEWVRRTEKGWIVTIPPGGHPRLLPQRYEVPRELGKPSPDGRWHACGFHTIRCFLYVDWGA